MEELKVLVELQELDRRIAGLTRHKKTMPGKIERAKAGLDALQAETDEAKAVVDDMAKGKAEIDLDLKAENERVQKLKLRTTEIKTNKEYAAHLKEIEDCQKKISELEDKTLELMEQTEKAKSELAARQELLPAEEQRFKEKKAKIEAEFEKGEAELDGLYKRRGELVPKLSSSTAQYYDSMLGMYPEDVVVRAENGSCNGCRMTIPPQLFNNVRKGESIIKCSYCRRILYYAPQP